MSLSLLTPRPLRALVWMAGVIALFTVLGFFVLPPLLKAELQKVLSAELRRDVSIGSIAVNPYALTLNLGKVEIKERGGAGFVAFDALYANAEWSSVFRLAPVLKELRLSGPRIQIVRTEPGRYNFSDILEAFLAKPGGGPTPRFALNNIRIDKGRIDVDDQPAGSQHAVTDIDLGIPFISSIPSFTDIFVEPSLSAKVNGAPLELRGKSKPFRDSLETELALDIDDFALPRLNEYLPADLKIKIPSGRFYAKLAIKFLRSPDKLAKLTIAGDLGLADLVLTETAGKPLLTLPKLTLALADFEPLARSAKVSKLTFESPQISLRRDKAGHINWLQVLPPAKPAAADKGAKPFNFELTELALMKASISFDDDMPATPWRAVVTALNAKLAIKFLGAPDKAPKLSIAGDLGLADLLITETAGKPLLKLPKLAIALADFEPLARSAKVSKLSIESPEISLRRDKAGQINWLQALPPAKPAADDKDAGPFNLTVTELALAKASISFDDEMPATPWRAVVAALNVGVKGFSTIPAAPAQIEATVSGVRVSKAGAKEAVLTLPALQIKDASLDLAKRELMLGDVTSSGAKLAAQRDKDGKLDLQAMLAPSTAPATTSAKDTPWVVSLKTLALDSYGVRLKDESTRRTGNLVIEPIALSAQDLSTRKDAKGQIDLKATLNQKGALNIAGALVLQPLSGDMKLELKGMEILPFQPYFASKLNINITSGDVALKGAVKWKLGGPDAAPVSGDFSGALDVTQFAAVERRGAEDFLKWKSLHVGPFRGKLAPFDAAIDEIALADFYSRLVVLPEGRLNVQDIIRKPGDDAPAALLPGQLAAPKPAPPVVTRDAAAPDATASASATLPPEEDAGPPLISKIGRVTVQGGNINFSDRFIKPNYSANLTEVGGSITRLTAATPADVDLRGTVDNSAPLQISGKVNPLARDLFIDIRATVKGYDLSPISPYSGRYIGYNIQKGKLYMDASYKLENRKLTANNKLLLTQLTLGDKIENAEATQLPVSLALALLKDSKGNIDLEIPVSGSLDDPQFSVGAIVGKLIVNLIIKVVTAPFALLGALFGGGGAELSWIEFNYGYAALSATATEKLTNLVKALNDRPGLNVEIAGRVDPAQDREGLKQASLLAKVKTQKFRALARAGTPAASLSDVTIAADEYLPLLESAYDAEKFEKPRNLIGLAKSLPKDEMEKLLLANSTISDEALRQLAEQRARAVQQGLLKAGISAERVFLIAASIAAPEAKDKAKLSRADLSLK